MSAYSNHTHNKAATERANELEAEQKRERALAIRTAAQQVIFQCTNCWFAWRTQNGASWKPEGPLYGQVNDMQNDCRHIYQTIEAAEESHALDTLDLVQLDADVTQKRGLIDEIMNREFGDPTRIKK